MPSVTTSPALRYQGFGFLTSATPGGVPVVMISPGSKVVNCEQYATICATEKIIVVVEPSWTRLPLTSSHMESFCGSPTSSAVTSHGPTGPNVGNPLPLSQVPPRSCCQLRSETSFTTQ